MKKVVGVIVNEDVESGLLSTQFISPLLFLKENGYTVGVLNICKPWKRPVNNNINIRNIPIAIPAKFFMFNPLSFLFVPLSAFFYALILLFFVKKDVTYLVRSYYPSYIFALIKFFKPNLKFIFDSRSLFVDEYVGAGKIKPDSFNYKVWRKIEFYILRQSHKTLVVASKQEKIYRSIYPETSIEKVPCYTEVDLSVDFFKTDMLDQFNIPKHKVLICYFGSIDKGWNNIERYKKFLDANHENQNLHFIFISQNYRQLQNTIEFNQGNLTLIPVDVSLADKKRLMTQCDYGLFLMGPNPDWETRLGVKFVDYCASGLPVIISPYVGEAVNYIQQNEILEHSCKILEHDLLQNVIKTEVALKKQIQIFSLEFFSYKNLIRNFN
ncbi:hypothetical protein [Kangiella sp.]|uniref:hypothetical protein n=1 Tax=Gammaproteobacteria TaxID=1236 RepID=UPI003A92D7DA